MQNFCEWVTLRTTISYFLYFGNVRSSLLSWKGPLCLECSPLLGGSWLLNTHQLGTDIVKIPQRLHQSYFNWQAFYQPRSGMVIRKVELGLGILGHLGPVLFLPAVCGMVFLGWNWKVVGTFRSCSIFFLAWQTSKP